MVSYVAAQFVGGGKAIGASFGGRNHTTILHAHRRIASALASPDQLIGPLQSAVAAGITLPPQALQLLDKASPAAVLDALKSSGLALNGRRAPQEVIVIDSMERVPTEN